MDHQLSENVWKVLKCPNCGGSLDRISVGAVCNHCRTRYLCTDSGSLDLRLIGPKTCLYEFNLGSALLPESGFDFGVLSNNDAPEVDFGNFKGKHHLTKEIISHFPKAKTNESLMLDLVGSKFNSKASVENLVIMTTGHFTFIARRKTACQEALR